MQNAVLPIFLFLVCAIGLAVGLLIVAGLFNPGRPGRVKRMPYESGMDPIHDTRRRFDVRFHLLAIAFLVFDVELLFLVPWAVAFRPAEERVDGGQWTASSEETGRGKGEGGGPFSHPSPSLGIDAAVRGGLVESRHMVFVGAMIFVALLALGFVYDWCKGVFRWR
jgi:NADH-quinone oxidoreductase subunit A